MRVEGVVWGREGGGRTLELEPGRAELVPGRAKPVSGRPEELMGRTPWLGIPLFCACRTTRPHHAQERRTRRRIG